MYDFAYHKASSAADAASKAKGKSDAKFMAGGQTLIPTMKQRLAKPSDVIDLGGASDLKGISAAGGAVTIGAMATHAAVAGSADVKKAIPALAALAEGIGDPQVRNRGTIGGSVANNDPAADYPAAVLGLGATVHTDQRQIAADAVTGAGNGVIRMKSMEAALDKNWSPAALDGVKVPAGTCNGDIHGSPEYRAHLITVMAKRAVAAAG